jgi:5-(hydroxymethyl)furfural/furfural oxidase
MPHVTNSFDYIIVGAGAAGCVAACRLSERASTSVLLIEAGADVLPGHEPADILDSYPASYYNKSYLWPGLKAHWRTARTCAATGFPQGRVMGGGGTVMGMVALRGTPADYADWERFGATGWGWSDVLPYFRKLETDLDFRNDMHGGAGPMPLRRVARDDWPALPRALADYAASRGLPWIADMNADFRDGYCSVPMTNTPERRASTAICYLTAEVRRRPNLTVLTSAAVTKIRFQDRRAAGVTAQVNGADRAFDAREIIVCAGAIFSPPLLMRSGIGRAESLRALGIQVVADLPGVGANLQNHPTLFIGFRLKREARQSSESRSQNVTSFRYSSRLEGCAPADLYINVQSKTSWNALGQQIGQIAPYLLRPFSRGRVSLRSAAPQDLPLIEFNFLDDPRDLQRLCGAYARAVEIAFHESARALYGRPFPVRFSDRLRRLNELSRWNGLKSSAIAKMLDVMPSLSDAVLGSLTGAKVDLEAIAADGEQLAEHIRDNLAGVFHPAGTCRMGAHGDRTAVVDPAGRVWGVGGLRVIDASVMPQITSANTNAASLMIGERGAALVMS